MSDQQSGGIVQPQNAEYVPDWLNDRDLPHGGIYVVRGPNGVHCTTSPFKEGWERAEKIAAALNAQTGRICGAVKMSDGLKCGERWALDDPNDEDRALGRTHYCTQEKLHDGVHKCFCGSERAQ